MTVAQSLALFQGLRTIGELALPAKIAYRIAKAIAGVEPVVQAWERTRAATVKAKADFPEAIRAEQIRKELEGVLAEDAAYTPERFLKIEDLGDAKVPPIALAQCEPIMAEEENP